MGKVELIISGGTLNLYKEEAIPLNYNISSIKSITDRKSPFSKSIVIPGDKNNNQLMGHIFEIGSDSSFNPQKKTPAYVLVDDIGVFQDAYLQLTKINVSKKFGVSYEVNLIGETDDLVKDVGENYLEDYDWSQNNHTWSFSSITDSWTSTTKNYYYPLIDYTGNWDYYYLNAANNNTGLGVSDFFPAIKLKHVWDTIFSAANRTYISNFLDSAFFDSLYIPYNGNIQLSQDISFATNRGFRAQMSGDTHFIHPANGFSHQIRLPFNNTSALNFDTGGLFENSVYKYSADTYSVQRFSVVVDVAATASTGNFTLVPSMTVRFYRSGYQSGTQPFYQNNTPLVYSRRQYLIQTDYLDNTPVSFGNRSNTAPGEEFWAEAGITYSTNNIPTGNTVFIIYSANTYFYNEVSTATVPGQTLNYNGLIPKKVKAIDLVKSVISAFNLMVEPSKDNERKLIIEPRNAYYATGRTYTMTNKLDLTKPINEQLISEQQNKRIILKYKEDKDYYNEDYKSKLNQSYGEYVHEIDNDFVDGDKTIELIFSPTPLTALEGSSNIVLPTIAKLNNGQLQKTESNIRLLLVNQGSKFIDAGGDTWMFNGVSFSGYPFIGHLDHPFSGNTDLNFGRIDYGYYQMNSITDNNLHLNYYQDFLEQISDKNSKLITCYMNLTPVDFNNFRYNDNWYIEGLTSDGGHYFTINKIEYDPTSSSPAKVELMKLPEKFVRRTQLVVLPGHVHVSRPTGSVLAGAGNTINASASLATGYDNLIDSNATGVIVAGERNVVEQSARNSSIVGGSSNRIASGVTGSTIIGGNGITASTSNTIVAGGRLVVQGSISATSGFESIKFVTGSTGIAGTVLMQTGGTPTQVFTSAIQDNSLVFLSAQDNNVKGALRVSSRSAGVSFNVTSTNAADTGSVAWFIVSQ